MPTNKPFFPNLRPVKKAVTPQGEILIRENAGADRSSWGPLLRSNAKNA
jgi:hypothetical protein